MKKIMKCIIIASVTVCIAEKVIDEVGSRIIEKVADKYIIPNIQEGK